MIHQWIVRKMCIDGELRIQRFLSPFRNTNVDSPTALSPAAMSAMLSSTRRRFRHLGASVHASLVKNHLIFWSQGVSSFNDAFVVWNSLISWYAKSGLLDDAVKLFDDMPVKDTVSWNSIIAGVMFAGEFSTGFGYFKQMLESGVNKVDKATMTTILASCKESALTNTQRMIHAFVVRCGLSETVAVGNALITSYFKCSSCKEAKMVFDEMGERNVITWTAIISGLAHKGMFRESLNLFSEMNRGSVQVNSLTFISTLLACSGLQAVAMGSQLHAQIWKMGIHAEILIESALMDMYSKSGAMEETWKIFESAEEIDEISLTIIMVNLTRNGLQKEAFQIFKRMMNEGFRIDSTILCSVLGAVGDETSHLCQQMHSSAIKNSFSCNTFVGNGLISAYSKAGYVADAMKVFRTMPTRNTISWNTIIAACARNGEGHKALELYEEMQRSGAEPSEVTFLSLLHGCSHAALLEEGMALFKSMTEVFKIQPREEHYAAIVDMLGRAGLLDETLAFIEGMREENRGEYIWEALLGACGKHGAIELGVMAAEKLMAEGAGRAELYVSLGNMLSRKSRWDEKAELMGKMKELQVVRDVGISWVEIQKSYYS